MTVLPSAVNICTVAVAAVHLQCDEQTWDAAQPQAVAFHPLRKLVVLGSVDRVRRKKAV